jgi:GNAT superfamily N-acetyltransferase
VDRESLKFDLLATPPVAKMLLAFREDAGWTTAPSRSVADALCSNPRMRWAVVRRGQKTIAIARLEIAPPQFCFISDFIVLNAWHGRGVGTWFMERIEEHCRAMTILRILLEPAEGSRGFYERLGFAGNAAIPGFMVKYLFAPSPMEIPVRRER